MMEISPGMGVVWDKEKELWLGKWKKPMGSAEETSEEVD